VAVSRFVLAIAPPVTGVPPVRAVGRGCGALSRTQINALASNFGRPAALFKRFPNRDVFITDRNGR
jgi:hypothetical protein